MGAVLTIGIASPSYVRWRSDDPEIFMEPVDLFYEQDRGLPENCGKKDRKTTLQAYFMCHPCQCDLMGIVPLRSVTKNNIIMFFFQLILILFNSSEPIAKDTNTELKSSNRN